MPSERYGNLLIPIIVNRMPKETTCQVAKNITQEISPIEEILNIIWSEVEAKEFSAKGSCFEAYGKVSFTLSTPKACPRNHTVIC